MAGSRFYIQVYQGLLSPKHRKAMGEAVWLYLWLLDHQTGEDGKVLGGDIIPARRICEDLGICEKTLYRWLARLSDYVDVDSALFRGYTFRIRKPKKVFKRKMAEAPRDGQNCPTDKCVSGQESPSCGTGESVVEDKNVRRHIRNTRQLDSKTDKSMSSCAFVEEFKTTWNDFSHLPRITKMTEGRVARLRRRMKDEEFAIEYPKALRYMARTPFYIGENDRGWRASVDWFLKNDENWRKPLERVQHVSSQDAERIRADQKAAEDAPPSPEFKKLIESMSDEED